MRIVVVGGVGGGMGCAARARRLSEDAEIIVIDRGEHVSFANCGLPYYVGGEIESRDALLVQTPGSLKDSLNLDVRTRQEVIGLDSAAQSLTVRTAEGDYTLDYDALVLSPGAAALRPPIPGLESPRVRTLRTVEDAVALRQSVDAGARDAVVLGAGFIGLEAAEALAQQGLRVTIVELAPHVMPPVEDELAFYVTKELERQGITVRAGVGAQALESGDDAETVVLSDGSHVRADLVVLSVGVRPDTAAFERDGVECVNGAIVVDEHGRTNLPHIWAIGDAVTSRDAVTGAVRPVPLAGPANRAGRLVADDIVRPESARPIPPPLGTAIVRVGELTAAITGANSRALNAAGIAFRTIHLHPNNHAGYFPGASPVHLIVHFGEDGRLLGAQAVGADGVDKRIDVLATAIRNGMHVADLIDVDLSYSPPYGQAKDPVNLAGMEAENVLNGTLELWYAQDLSEVMANALVLDARSREEYATGHVPGSLCIPHTELRGRTEEVRAAANGRPVRVMCAAGIRSYIAHRVLVAAGLDSASLSGGMETLQAVLGDEADGLLETGAAV